MSKSEKYEKAIEKIETFIKGEKDEIAILSTVCCELHQAFKGFFDWTGFYRKFGKEKVLKVGPYQGTHGCLTIPFERGVCGKTARDKETQLVPDVEKCPYHIACSSSTKSEIVVPIVLDNGELHSVLDVDSNTEKYFDETDQKYLDGLCKSIGVILSKIKK